MVVTDWLRPYPLRFHVEEAAPDDKLIQHGPLHSKAANNYHLSCKDYNTTHTLQFAVSKYLFYCKTSLFYWSHLFNMFNAYVLKLYGLTSFSNIYSNCNTLSDQFFSYNKSPVIEEI